MNSYSTSWWSLLLIYRPCEDEKLSWPCWLTYSGRFTHINGYPSAAGPVQISTHDQGSSNIKLICRMMQPMTVNECKQTDSLGIFDWVESLALLKHTRHNELNIDLSQYGSHLKHKCLEWSNSDIVNLAVRHAEQQTDLNQPLIHSINDSINQSINQRSYQSQKVVSGLHNLK